MTLLDRALQRLADEYKAQGKQNLFAEPTPFLAHQSEARAYEEPARRTGLSAGTFAVTVHRFRARYRELLRLEVADTLVNPADLEDELHRLFT